MGGQEACCLQEQRDVLHMEDYTVSPVSERIRKLRIEKRGAPGSRRTAKPADEKAVAPQAQGVFRGGVSSVVSRSRRSVTRRA